MVSEPVVWRQTIAVPRPRLLRLGVVSDTHGLVRSEAVERLAGSDAILHAGDVGGPEVLEELSELAPVHVVRGNVDLPEHLARSRRRAGFDAGWAAGLPDRLELEVGGLEILVVHDVKDLPDGWRADVVVVGHSHVPRIERVEGTLFVNPGSAGPRRFRLPVTVGELRIEDGGATAEVVELAI